MADRDRRARDPIARRMIVVLMGFTAGIATAATITADPATARMVRTTR